ncbi:hypothetical protein E3J79_03870 [Candidatus Dependentiae bacterium]|nr:MAG: hypothetical protein E3J79_03870 [Candidatus Dependentiae bacterium]
MKKPIIFIFIFSLFITCLSHATWTDLHEAAKSGSLEQVQNILDSGADVNAVSQDSFRPYKNWTIEDDADVVGWSPLDVAVKHGFVDIAALLIERGAAVNAADQDGNTPLHVATYEGQEATAQLLLNRGANINAANKSGWTALHFASRYGHPAIVNLLVDKGANIDSKNNYNYVPLHSAAFGYNSECVQALLKKGAKPPYETVKDITYNCLIHYRKTSNKNTEQSKIIITLLEDYQGRWQQIRQLVKARHSPDSPICRLTPMCLKMIIFEYLLQLRVKIPMN